MAGSNLEMGGDMGHGTTVLLVSLGLHNIYPYISGASATTTLHLTGLGILYNIKHDLFCWIWDPFYSKCENYPAILSVKER